MAQEIASMYKPGSNGYYRLWETERGFELGFEHNPLNPSTCIHVFSETDLEEALRMMRKCCRLRRRQK